MAMRSNCREVRPIRESFRTICVKVRGHGSRNPLILTSGARGLCIISLGRDGGLRVLFGLIAFVECCTKMGADKPSSAMLGELRSAGKELPAMARLAQALKNLMVIVSGGLELIRETSAARTHWRNWRPQMALFRGISTICHGRLTFTSYRVNFSGGKFALGST